MNNLHEGQYDHEDYFPFNRDDNSCMSNPVYNMSIAILDLTDEGHGRGNTFIELYLNEIAQLDTCSHSDMVRYVEAG